MEDQLRQENQRLKEELYLVTQRFKLLREASDEITFEYTVDTDSAVFHHPGLGEKEKLILNFMKDQKIKELVTPEDYETCEQQMEELLEKAQKRIYEFRAFDLCTRKILWYRAYLASLVSSDGEIFKIVGSFKNITTELKVREALTQKENIDFMTGLLNSAAMERNVRDCLSGPRCKEYRAMLLIDADKFKRINDSLGHLVGDAVIRYFAKQIKKNLGDNDLVGRIGGDEFMVFLERDIKDSVISIAEKINMTVREPFQVEGINIQMSCSIGIVFEPKRGADYETLFAAADQALFDVKRDGRDHYAIHVIK